MSVASLCCTCFCVVLCVSFCAGHFVTAPLNLTYRNCLQHSLFEHLFNLYYYIIQYLTQRDKPDIGIIKTFMARDCIYLSLLKQCWHPQCNCLFLDRIFMSCQVSECRVHLQVFKGAMSVSFRSELFTSYILSIYRQWNLLP